MGVALVVAIWVGVERRFAEAGGATDHMLVNPGPERGRPFEGLVVEAGREQGAQQAVQGHQVERERGPAVLACRDQPVLQLGHGRPAVGLGARPFAEPHERVRLLRTGREDAARAMVLEAAPDQPHAAREQRRGERIARVPLMVAAIEAEAERLAAVDQPARGQSERLGRARGRQRLRGDGLRFLEAERAIGHRSAVVPGLGGLREGAGQDLVAQRVAAHDQPLPATRDVVPVFLVRAARIGALVDVSLPLRVPRPARSGAAGASWHHRRRRTRCARADRRTGRGSASPQEPSSCAAQCQPGVGPAPFSSRSAPVSKRSRLNASFSGCGASFAMVWANTQPEPGVALKPP